MSLEKFQQEILKSNVDAFIITKNNAYINEDVLDEENLVQALTGFSGSNGTLLVFPNQVFLFTDGRYEIQAKQEVDNEKVEVVISDFNQKWLRDNIKKHTKIGFNPWCHSIINIERLTEDNDHIKFVEDESFGNIFSDKEVVVFDHNIEFAGVESQEKISLLTSQINKMGVDAFFIPSADSVSWLLNQRSNLLPTSPIYRAMALVNKDGEITVFNKLSEVDKAISKYKKGTIAFCFYRTPQKIKSLMEKHKIQYFSHIDPCQEMKAIKNAVELKGMKKSHIRDGVSIVKFLHWLESNWQQQTEFSVAAKLYDFRKNNDNFFSNSFNTIAGFKENAALAHYSPTAENCKKLDSNGMLLIDSGAQYLDGTTDITRTIALGDISEEQKDFYTIVLKAHIALAGTIFPHEKINGLKLDVISRRELWKYGKTYSHGTGHGVGCFLNVHEGPQSISSRGANYPIKEGMVVSIEPGYYVENAFGVRIENLYHVARMNEEFLYFEPLTIAPIDKKLINSGLLCGEEKSWLNNYHELVYSTLEPLLNDEEKAWLKNACSPL